MRRKTVVPLAILLVFVLVSLMPVHTAESDNTVPDYTPAMRKLTASIGT